MKNSEKNILYVGAGVAAALLLLGSKSAVKADSTTLTTPASAPSGVLSSGSLSDSVPVVSTPEPVTATVPVVSTPTPSPTLPTSPLGGSVPVVSTTPPPVVSGGFTPVVSTAPTMAAAGGVATAVTMAAPVTSAAVGGFKF